MAECDQDSEMLMESEISRRFLQQARYITPGTLKRDQPVCNGGAPGDPYTSGGRCIPQPSHPYRRGCSKYYRCRDGS
ncbi:protein ralf-like 32 [Phtheirospermum japonicum]|uniref:Protein ralf-like 32 n=1 Tax=Phtheirospermum japonicum TaxID=374723 RepID=A0A830CKB1_9LAMI|nr:protein ralf-like 32 [Phtheirospermum japonicum]